CGTKTLTSDTAGVTLTCQVVNGAGLSSSASITIKIDATAPSIAGLPTACSLWPPNQKIVTVATITAGDALSGLLAGSLQVGGTSNEPTDPLNPDIAITPKSGGFTVQLRADRLGEGNGRIYTLTAQAKDRAGNTAYGTAACVVPHDQGQSQNQN